STPGITNDLKMLFIGHMVASLEHHVLEKMRKSGFADLFSGRPDVIRYIYMNNRIAVIFMNNQRKPVGQHIFFIRYNDLISLFGDFFYKLRLPGHYEAEKDGDAGQQQEFLFHNRNFGLKSSV